MPDAAGRIRGISVPRIPWHEERLVEVRMEDGTWESAVLRNAPDSVGNAALIEWNGVTGWYYKGRGRGRPNEWRWHEHSVPKLGEKYGMWCFDDQIYVRFVVTEITADWVKGKDVLDGSEVGVGLKRLAKADRL